MSSPIGHLVDKAAEHRGDKPVPNVQGSSYEGSREAVRKRTFTRWINKLLEKCDPPLKVDDLFTDVQDGRVLMALLEELSGCKMLCRFRPSTNSIFRLSNIAKVLDFLEERNMRVVNIDAADVADGRPSVVLRLIWYIIVYFQLKEVNRNLEKRYSSVSSLVSLADSSDSLSRGSPVAPSVEYSSTLSSKRKRASHQPKYHSRAIMALLNWVQCCTLLYGVEVDDFSESWRNGLAFLALVKCARPKLVDMKEALCSNTRQNLTMAFRIAQHSLDIPPLLDPDDVMVRSPDEQSIITYVAQFRGCFPVNREYNISTLSLEEEFNSVEDQSRSSSICNVMRLGRDRNSSSEVTQVETASTSKSLTVCNSSLCAKKESNFQNGQFLLSSTEGSHQDSLAQEISPTVWKDEGLFLSSEEGVYTLDTDEEDAYKYILELEKEQSESHEGSDLHPTLNEIIYTQQEHCNLQVDNVVKLHQGNGEQYCNTSLGGKLRRHQQPLSENSANSERCMCEIKVLYTNNSQHDHKHSKKGTDPKLCAFKHNVNVKGIPELQAHRIKLCNKDRTDLCSKDSTVKEDFQNKNSSNITCNEPLSVVESLKENSHREDDSENYISMRKSVEDENSLQQGSFTHQTTFFLGAEKKSNLASDVCEILCPDVICSEIEMLHKIFFLWIFVYCIFMLWHLEFGELLNLFSFA